MAQRSQTWTSVSPGSNLVSWVKGVRQGPIGLIMEQLAVHPLHNVYMEHRNCFRLNKLGLILKSQISNTIEHVIIPTCSVESKIEKIKFLWASNPKFVIFPHSPVASTKFRVKLFPFFGYRRILLSHVQLYILCTGDRQELQFLRGSMTLPNSGFIWGSGL